MLRAIEKKKERRRERKCANEGRETEYGEKEVTVLYAAKHNNQ